MLTLLVDFSDQFSVFNIFRYITFRTGGALITSALLVFIFGPLIIDSLRIRQGKGQPIRADGPQTHFKKAGTPTMGGLMILSGIVGSSLLWVNLSSIYVWVVLFVTLGFGAIGFYDDYLKVTKQSHLGLSGKKRLGIEFVIAGIAAWVIMQAGQAPFSSSLTFPFIKDFLLNLGWFFIPFSCLVVLGWGYAVNITFWLDVFAFVPIMIAGASLGVLAYV
jgi:phospho-N-acetylmuramoyl-pentapeptide-transferase